LCDNSGEHIELTEVEHEKDLGVWINSDLKSSMHCTKAVAFAMRVPYMIKRKISKQPFVFLYKTYVRPHLEYCSWRTTNESILVSVIRDSEKNSWLIIIKTGLHGTL